MIAGRRRGFGRCARRRQADNNQKNRHDHSPSDWRTRSLALPGRGRKRKINPGRHVHASFKTLSDFSSLFYEEPVFRQTEAVEINYDRPTGASALHWPMGVPALQAADRDRKIVRV